MDAKNSDNGMSSASCHALVSCCGDGNHDGFLQEVTLLGSICHIKQNHLQDWAVARPKLLDTYLGENVIGRFSYD